MSNVFGNLGRLFSSKKKLAKHSENEGREERRPVQKNEKSGQPRKRRNSGGDYLPGVPNPYSVLTAPKTKRATRSCYDGRDAEDYSDEDDDAVPFHSDPRSRRGERSFYGGKETSVDPFERSRRRVKMEGTRREAEHRQRRNHNTSHWGSSGQEAHFNHFDEFGDSENDENAPPEYAECNQCEFYKKVAFQKEMKYNKYKNLYKHLDKSYKNIQSNFLKEVTALKNENDRQKQEIRSLKEKLSRTQTFRYGNDGGSTGGTTNTFDSSIAGSITQPQFPFNHGYANGLGSSHFPTFHQNQMMAMMSGLPFSSNSPKHHSSPFGSLGAGDALASDVSLLRIKSPDSVQRSLRSSNFDEDQSRHISDEMDETKNFRANNDNSFVSMAMETPREANESGTSIGLERTSSVVLSHRDDGYSTCSTLTRTASSTSNLRRSSSDSKITSPIRRNL